jgi:hypothetical protein
VSVKIFSGYRMDPGTCLILVPLAINLATMNSLCQPAIVESISPSRVGSVLLILLQLIYIML